MYNSNTNMSYPPSNMGTGYNNQMNMPGNFSGNYGAPMAGGNYPNMQNPGQQMNTLPMGNYNSNYSQANTVNPNTRFNMPANQASMTGNSGQVNSSYISVPGSQTMAGNNTQMNMYPMGNVQGYNGQNFNGNTMNTMPNQQINYSNTGAVQYDQTTHMGNNTTNNTNTSTVEKNKQKNTSRWDNSKKGKTSNDKNTNSRWNSVDNKADTNNMSTPVFDQSQSASPYNGMNYRPAMMPGNSMVPTPNMISGPKPMQPNVNMTTGLTPVQLQQQKASLQQSQQAGNYGPKPMTNQPQMNTNFNYNPVASGVMGMGPTTAPMTSQAGGNSGVMSGPNMINPWSNTNNSKNYGPNMPSMQTPMGPGPVNGPVAGTNIGPVNNVRPPMMNMNSNQMAPGNVMGSRPMMTPMNNPMPNTMMNSQQTNVPMSNMNMMQSQINKNIPGNTNMQPMNTNMPSMNSNIPPMNTNMQSMNTNMAPMNTNMAPMNANMGPMNANMPPMNANMGPMNTNMGPMNTNMAPMNTNMAPMNTNMAPMNTNMPSMNSNMPPMNANQPGINTNMAPINSGMPGMNSNMPSMNSSMPSMNTNTQPMNSNINNGLGNNMMNSRMSNVSSGSSVNTLGSKPIVSVGNSKDLNKSGIDNIPSGINSRLSGRLGNKVDSTDSSSGKDGFNYKSKSTFNSKNKMSSQMEIEIARFKKAKEQKKRKGGHDGFAADSSSVSSSDDKSVGGPSDVEDEKDDDMNSSIKDNKSTANSIDLPSAFNSEALYCHICELGQFESLKEFREHLEGLSHKSIEEQLKKKHDKTLELCRIDVKLRNQRKISAAQREAQKAKKGNVVPTPVSTWFCNQCNSTIHGPKYLHNTSLEHKTILHLENRYCCGRSHGRDYSTHLVSIEHLRKQYDEDLQERELEKAKNEANGPNIEEDPANIESILTRLKKFEENDGDWVKPFGESDTIGINYIDTKLVLHCKICDEVLKASEWNLKYHCKSVEHYNKISSQYTKQQEESWKNKVPLHEGDGDASVDSYTEKLEKDLADKMQEIKREDKSKDQKKRPANSNPYMKKKDTTTLMELKELLVKVKEEPKVEEDEDYNSDKLDFEDDEDDDDDDLAKGRSWLPTEKKKRLC